MLITGFDERSSCGETWVANECIAPIATRYPDRFIPYAGADVLAGMSAVREFAYWVRERGFRGLSLRPFMIGVPADDRRYYPLYAKCVELGVPVSIHTSANWTTMRDSDLGHPRHLDVVAGDFPELTIIISHGGYPWVLEAVLLAWKHPRVGTGTARGSRRRSPTRCSSAPVGSSSGARRLRCSTSSARCR